MTKYEGVLPSTPSPFSQTLSHEDETRFADQCANEPEQDQIYSVCNALALAVLTQGNLSATNARRLLNDCLPPTLLTLALSLSKPQTHPSPQGSLQQIVIIENHTVIRKGLHITCHILAPSSTAAQQVVSTGHPIIHKINPAEEEEKGGEQQGRQEGGKGGEEGKKPHVSPIIATSYADWTDLLKPYSEGKVSHIITLPVHQPSGNRPMGAITALLSHSSSSRSNEEGGGGGEGVNQDVVKLYDDFSEFSECLGRCLAHQMKCVWESSFSMMAKVLPPQMMTRMITAAMACPSTTRGEGELEERGCNTTGEAVMEEEEGGGAEKEKGMPPSLSLLLKGKEDAPTSALALASVNEEEEEGNGNPHSLSPRSLARLNSQTFISTATSSRGSGELPCPSTLMHGNRPVVSVTQMRSITSTTWGHNHHHQEEEEEEEEVVGGGSGQYNKKKKQTELFENKEEEDTSKKSHQEEEPPSLKTVDLSFSDGKMEQEYHRHFNTKNASRDKMLLSQYACIVAACFLFTILNFTPVRTFGINKASCLEDRVRIVGTSTLAMVIMKLYQLAQATACTLGPLALLRMKREWYVANRTTVLGAARIFRLALIVFVWGISQMLLPSLFTEMTETQIMVMNNLLSHMMRCSRCIMVLGAFKHRIPFRSHIVLMVVELYISLLVTALVFTNIDTAASHSLHRDEFYTVVGQQCAAAAVSSLIVYLAERQDRRRFFKKKKEEERYQWCSSCLE